MQTFQTKILGTGVYLPKKILTNKDLESIVETTDDWIFERTGIRERRISDPKGGEYPTDMALHATHMALKNAGLSVNDIDLILFATSTPDQRLPSSSCLLQQKLGMSRTCAAVDISAACTGFVYGVNMAHSFVQTGLFKTILVVGSEMLSPSIDWQDRKSCILFGDACGVALLGRSPEGDPSQIYSTVLDADGTGKEFFFNEHGGSVSPITHEVLNGRLQYMKMNGQEMFKVAVRTLVDNAQKALDLAKLSLSDVTWMVPHQANLRIIEATANRLGVDMSKVIVNIQKYGNTSAATVPVAFHEAITDGRIKRGDIVLFDGFGAGLTSGATVFKY